MRRMIAFFSGMIAGIIAVIAAGSATAETLKVAVAQRGFWNSASSSSASSGLLQGKASTSTSSIRKAAPRPSPR